MIRVAVVGLGKMGLSHLSIINAHPEVRVEAICDESSYLLAVLERYTGLRTFKNFEVMLESVELDALIVVTPSNLHTSMIFMALQRGLNVFCEKPFCIDAAKGAELVQIAEESKLVNQIGYHNRFVATFAEVKKLVVAGAIGTVTHVLAEAYGPVVLKAKPATWRTRRASGGGCLYDYAAHPINLVNWYFGKPQAVGGTILNQIFSTETEDEVFGSFYFESGMSAQISVSWSNESYRKMTTMLHLSGTLGNIYVDRQECNVYLRARAPIPPGYTVGWNIRYTTELTAPVWFFVRGEEYSAQLDYFVRCIKNRVGENVNSFRSALMTDEVITMMVADAAQGPVVTGGCARKDADLGATPATRWWQALPLGSRRLGTR
jgi:predicted dehydrogenase